MKEKNSRSTLKTISILIIVFSIFYFTLRIVYVTERPTVVSIVGGISEETAVEISTEKKIRMKVPIGEVGWLYNMYAYWDENTEEKQILKKDHSNIARGEIKVPDTIGMHKLTIVKGMVSYHYYYDVVYEESN